MTTSSPEFSLLSITVLKNDEGSVLLEDAMRFGFYAAIIAIFLMIVALVVKLLWNFDEEDNTRATETSSLLAPEDKIMFNSFGTSEEDDVESGCGSSSSDDLYDEKICAICYDDQRSCLFVPCGHCVTCFTCAKRITNDQIKSCPICRTIIHKVRRLRIL